VSWRFLHWLGWLARGRDVASPTQTAASAGAGADQPDDEVLLSTYLRRIGVLDERPQRADDAAMAALKRLGQSGREAAALRLGGALAAALPEDDALQLLVAEQLLRQQLGDTALPLLQRVLARTDPTAHTQENAAQKRRARWIAAEIAAATAQTAVACEHLLQLLAEDFHHPGAKERLRALRNDAQLEPRPGTAHVNVPWSATLSAATAAAPTLLGSERKADARYKLRAELGCGKSGTVYLADDEELGCAVALKLFHPHKTAQKSQPALREARLLSSLRHPGVLFLYDLDAEARYLTMEHCEGGSLRARLQKAPLPPPVALRRAIELGDTLRAVHGLSIAHGDVKPENLLFRGLERSLLEKDVDPPYGDLVLGDFGVGVDVTLSDHDPRSAAGTLAYLPPERLRGAPPSAAADLYAFGVVLGELFGPALADAPAPLRALLAELRSPDAAARPTAQVALTKLRALS
jgi:hypothetical protein